MDKLVKISPGIFLGTFPCEAFCAMSLLWPAAYKLHGLTGVLKTFLFSLPRETESGRVGQRESNVKIMKFPSHICKLSPLLHYISGYIGKGRGLTVIPQNSSLVSKMLSGGHEHPLLLQIIMKTYDDWPW